MIGFVFHHLLALVLSLLLFISNIEINNASFLVHRRRLSFHYVCNMAGEEESDGKKYMPSPSTLISDLPPSERGIGVGIDLGTTNSAVAIFSDDGIPHLIPIEGKSTMPSVVSVSSKFDQQQREEIVVVGGGGDVSGDGRISQSHKKVLSTQFDYDDTNDGDEQRSAFTYRHVKRVIGMGTTTAACSAEVVPHVVIHSDSQRRKGRSFNKKNKEEGLSGLSLDDMLEDARENPVRLSLPDGCNYEEIFGGRKIVGDQNCGDSTTVSPERISSLILKKMFDTAEKVTGERITRVVLGVPAYFNDQQRDATIKAATLASSIPTDRIRLLREPEAAALAYGIGKKQIGKGNDDEFVLVFDLGGGTFDVSILEVGGGVYEVVATGGNTMLGGSDFDAKLAQFFSKMIMKHGCEKNYWKEAGNVAAVMVTVAERCRIALSNARDVVIHLPLTAEGWLKIDEQKKIILSKRDLGDGYESFNEKGTSDGAHLTFKLTRKAMEKLCLEEFQALLRPVREVAIMAGALLPGDASPSAIEDALQMEEDLEKLYGDKPFFDSFFDAETENPRDEINEEEINRQMLLQVNSKKDQQRGRKRARNMRKNERKFNEEKRKAGDKARQKSTNSRNKIQDGINGRRLTQVVLVGGATRMPAIGRLLTAITGVAPQRTVNPDEAVALGCAVQVGILDGINTDLRVLTPIEAAMMRALARKRGLDMGEESLAP